jgi:hypothetical protein
MTAVTQTGFRNNIRKYLDAVELEGVSLSQMIIEDRR